MKATDPWVATQLLRSSNPRIALTVPTVKGIYPHLQRVVLVLISPEVTAMNTLGPAGDAECIVQLKAENTYLKKENSALRKFCAETVESRDAWRNEATLDPDNDAAMPADLIKQIQRENRGLREFVRYLLEQMPADSLIAPPGRAILPSVSAD